MPHVVRDLRFKHPNMKQTLEEILYLDAKSRSRISYTPKLAPTDRQIALSATYIDALAQHAFHHPEHVGYLVDDRYVNGVTSKTMFCLVGLAIRLEPEDPDASSGDEEEDVSVGADRRRRFGPGGRYEVEVVETTAACKAYATHRLVDDLPENAMTGYERDRYPRGRCVYVIECETGRIKIGVSKQPRSRIAGVMRTAGVRHVAIHVTEAFMDATKVEAAFKRRFADRKTEGEWFTVSAPEALAWLMDQDWHLDDLAQAETYAAEERLRSEGRGMLIEKMTQIVPAKV